MWRAGYSCVREANLAFLGKNIFQNAIPGKKKRGYTSLVFIVKGGHTV
jgi:hypothetical protein